MHTLTVCLFPFFPPPVSNLHSILSFNYISFSKSTSISNSLLSFFSYHCNFPQKSFITYALQANLLHPNIQAQSIWWHFNLKLWKLVSSFYQMIWYLPKTKYHQQVNLGCLWKHVLQKQMTQLSTVLFCTNVNNSLANILNFHSPFTHDFVYLTISPFHYFSPFCFYLTLWISATMPFFLL